MAPPHPEGNDRGGDGLEPEFPDEAGVEVPHVPIERVEPERMLENEVRARLESDGFSDDQNSAMGRGVLRDARRG